MYKACIYDIYGLLSSVIYGSNKIPRDSELSDRRHDLRSAKYFSPIIHFLNFWFLEIHEISKIYSLVIIV